MKIPNILTIGRILIAPILVVIYYLSGELSDWLSCIIFVIAAFTDYLDGFFARLYKQQSKFGELLDPIADKVLVATALGKTVIQMTAISILLAGNSGDKFLFDYGIELGIYLLWMSAILTLWTGYAYLRKGIDLID